MTLDLSLWGVRSCNDSQLVSPYNVWYWCGFVRSTEHKYICFLEKFPLFMINWLCPRNGSLTFSHGSLSFTDVHQLPRRNRHIKAKDGQIVSKCHIIQDGGKEGMQGQLPSSFLVSLSQPRYLTFICGCSWRATVGMGLKLSYDILDK